MKHIDFLTKVLMSDCEYWLVAKMDYVNRYGTQERLKDQIIFISIPNDIRRGLEKKDIMLSDLEALNSASIDCNIYLNEDYPPFQRYQTLNDVYIGFPIEFSNGSTKQMMIELITTNSKSLYDYKEIIDKYSKSNSEQNVKVSDTTEAK